MNSKKWLTLFYALIMLGAVVPTYAAQVCLQLGPNRKNVLRYTTPTTPYSCPSDATVAVTVVGPPPIQLVRTYVGKQTSPTTCSKEVVFHFGGPSGDAALIMAQRQEGSYFSFAAVNGIKLAGNVVAIVCPAK